MVVPMVRLGRFFSFLFFPAATAVAGAEQFVGGDAGSAVYLAWTADEAGHLQGQVQLVGLDPQSAARTRVTQASFSGSRRGADVSLAFPLLPRVRRLYVTGQVRRGVLTFDILGSDGTPHEKPQHLRDDRRSEGAPGAGGPGRRVRAIRCGATDAEGARAGVRLRPTRQDLKEQAARFPETVQCSG